MKTKLLLLFLLGFLHQLTGQENGNRLHFNISYFGILGTHPGIKVGVQYPLLTIVIVSSFLLSYLIPETGLSHNFVVVTSRQGNSFREPVRAP